jgi:hypothetical protein
MFENRDLLIVTKHQKEKVIAPILEKTLGVNCKIAEGFDTDSLGTFSGELERMDGPLVTARNKCLKALEGTGYSLAVASEGSFGPHPELFFASCDDEILILIDLENSIEVVVREISLETNFNGSQISSMEELQEFCENAIFPSHGLILRKAKDDFAGLAKGICAWEELLVVFNSLLELHGSAYVETDMRALYNPTRMAVIEKAARKLAAKAQSKCPECLNPGFGITEARQGLPCKWCGSPTRSTLSVMYVCSKCKHQKEEMFPNKKEAEDPMYCDYCNP